MKTQQILTFYCHWPNNKHSALNTKCSENSISQWRHSWQVSWSVSSLWGILSHNVGFIFSSSFRYISLSIIPSKSTHAIANGKISFFFKWQWYSIVCVCITLFYLHLLMSSWLFPILTYVKHLFLLLLLLLSLISRVWFCATP